MNEADAEFESTPNVSPLGPAFQDELAFERAMSGAAYPLDALKKTLETVGRAEMAGASASYLGYVLADLARSLRAPLAIIAPTVRAARQIEDAVRVFSAKRSSVLHLPAPDVSPYSGTGPDRDLTMERIWVSSQLPSLAGGDIVVCPTAAWLRKLPPADVIGDCTVQIRVDDELDTQRLKVQLSRAGYSAVSIVEDRGTFSVRGGVVDIFSPAHDKPIRIELYGDMVESIRTFDPESQRSADPQDQVVVPPVRGELFTDASQGNLRTRISDLAATLSTPSTRVGAILRDLAEEQRFFGIESYGPAFYDRLESVAEKLPPNTCVVVVHPAEVNRIAEQFIKSRETEYKRETGDGEMHFAIDEFFVTDEELDASFARGKCRLDVGALAADEITDRAMFPSLPNDDVERIRKQFTGDERFHQILAHVDRWRALYGRIVFSVSGASSVRRLKTLLAPSKQTLTEIVDGGDLLAPSKPPMRGFEWIESDLLEGFRSPSRGLALLTEREVFGSGRKRSGRQMAHEATAVASFKELAVGDLVVHIDFGIGRYAGLVRMDAGDVENDFLAVDYADGDRLYLPVYRLNRVQRYVGSAAFTRLDKLGGSTWERTKDKVKKQLQDIAGELIRLYAMRASQVGHAFRKPDEVFREFEASFPHEETPHQEQAINDVLRDMCRPKPMDRLLCGDVGFGKTEVAVRAAYKAAVDGRQVAVLVPTTVLAEQHAKTFRNRLADTAARVEVLSRFRSKQQVADTLTALAEGKVDVVVGTHRLLSKDVKFKDLGLLVVDEEQRFGVKHKEKLKTMRATIDVLTMTATPIPRTLEMSLLGIRDLSMIMTPPPGRLAIRTHVARFKETVLKDGILAEIKRGGQVFFVHNRVETINNVADELRRIIPDARIAVGHAQMPAGALEKVMMSVINHEVDVFVSTTIIESGIDISRANTIFINNADRFGLGQLHQLRGRVGRGNDRAYCYLLVQDPKRLKADARRRLEVIQQHTDLGAGIQIAHQDLDIRGAGNILGSDQSGHIEAVGFELYSELLQEAVAEMRGESEADADYEPEVKIPVAAYIPDEYVRDVGQRLLIYKRYSLASSLQALDEIHDEVEDRYGNAPESVASLRRIVELKLMMKAIRAESIEAGPKSAVIKLRADTLLSPDAVIGLIERSQGLYVFKPEMQIVRRLQPSDGGDILGVALQVAKDVSACAAS